EHRSSSPTNIHFFAATECISPMRLLSHFGSVSCITVIKDGWLLAGCHSVIAHWHDSPHLMEPRGLRRRERLPRQGNFRRAASDRHLTAQAGAILRWRHAYVVLEDTVEAGDGAETRSKNHFGNTQRGITEQRLGFFNPDA